MISACAAIAAALACHCYEANADLDSEAEMPATTRMSEAARGISLIASEAGQSSHEMSAQRRLRSSRDSALLLGCRVACGSAQ